MIQKIWDVNPSIGGPILKNKVWFNYTFRHWGSTKTKTDAYFDSNPSPFIYTPTSRKPGLDDGHIVSNAGRISWQVSGKDKISVYHDNQRKYRNHWGIAATIPPEAAGVQVTPTSFVNVTKWTRTHTNRLLLEAGFGIYNQEYTELYQPSVTGSEDKVWDDEAIRNSRVYNVVDASNNRQANAWPNPADHFSVLRTFMGAASYVAGSHSFRVGATLSNGDWKLLTMWTGDMQPITYNAGRPTSVTLRLPSDRNNGIKRDLGLYAQDRWSMGRITLNLGLRFDQFIGETRESAVLPSRHERRRHVRRVRRRQGRSGRPVHGHGAELEGHLAARRLRDGRVRQRPHRAQGELRALRGGPGDCVRQPGQPDRRAHRDGHARRGPTSTATACRSTRPATSSSTS